MLTFEYSNLRKIPKFQNRCLIITSWEVIMAACSSMFYQTISLSLEDTSINAWLLLSYCLKWSQIHEWVLKHLKHMLHFHEMWRVWEHRLVGYSGVVRLSWSSWSSWSSPPFLSSSGHQHHWRFITSHRPYIPPSTSGHSITSSMARCTPTASLSISATSPVTILQGFRIRYGTLCQWQPWSF